MARRFTYGVCSKTPPESSVIKAFRDLYPEAEERGSTDYKRVLLHDYRCKHAGRFHDIDIYAGYTNDGQLKGCVSGYQDRLQCFRGPGQLGVVVDNLLATATPSSAMASASEHVHFLYSICSGMRGNQRQGIIQFMRDTFPMSNLAPDISAHVKIHDSSCYPNKLEPRSMRIFWIDDSCTVDSGCFRDHKDTYSRFHNEEGLRKLVYESFQLAPLPAMASPFEHIAFCYSVCCPASHLLRDLMQRAFPRATSAPAAISNLEVHLYGCCRPPAVGDGSRKLTVTGWFVNNESYGDLYDLEGYATSYRGDKELRELVYASFSKQPPPSRTPPPAMAASTTATPTFADECAIAAYGTAVALAEHAGQAALKSALVALQRQLYSVNCTLLLAEMKKHDATTARMGQVMKEPFCIFRGSVLAMSKFSSSRTLDANPPEIGRLFVL